MNKYRTFCSDCRKSCSNASAKTENGGLEKRKIFRKKVKHKAFIEKALCLLAFSVLVLWRTLVRRRIQERKIYLPFSTVSQRVETFSTRCAKGSELINPEPFAFYRFDLLTSFLKSSVKGTISSPAIRLPTACITSQGKPAIIHAIIPFISRWNIKA